MSGLVPLLGGVVPNSNIFGELEATIAAQAATIAGLEGEIDDLEETIEEMEGTGWRQVGQIDFRTMTPTVITATGTVVDGVTFVNSALANPPLTASVALTISASGLNATGADTTSNRAVDIALADICDETLDTNYAYAFTMEVSAVPGASDTFMAGVGADANNFIGAGFSASFALAWHRYTSLWGVTQQVAHGGTAKQVGATVLPGGRMATVEFTATAGAAEAIRPETFPAPTLLPSHGTAGLTAQGTPDTLFLSMHPSPFFIQRITIWTDAPPP